MYDNKDPGGNHGGSISGGNPGGGNHGSGDSSEPRAPIPRPPIFTVVMISAAASLIAGFSSANIMSITGMFMMLFAAALAALLMTLVRSPMLLIMMPVTFITAILVGSDPIASLGTLAYIPAAVVMSAAVTARRQRVSVICRTSLALCVFLAVVYFSGLIYYEGQVSGEQIRSQIDSLHEGIKKSFLSLNEVQGELFFSESLSPELVSDAASAVLVIIPSFFVCAVNIFAFAAHALLVLMLRIFGAGDIIAPEQKIFKMSQISAIMYTLSYLLNMILAGSLNISPTQAVVYNINLLLLPGFMFAGISFYIRNRRRPPFSNIVFRAVAVAMMLFLTPVFLNSLAALGVISSFSMYFNKLMKPRK